MTTLEIDQTMSQLSIRQNPSDLSCNKEDIATAMGLASAVPTESAQSIVVRTCRACSGCYEYELEDEGIVTILTGIPGDKVRYKAVSFVWGPTIGLPVVCQSCSRRTIIPMASAPKFRNIMRLAGPGNLWLDALSIDQGNHQDVATQVASMGKIYSRAQCVPVLLPPSDRVAIRILAALTFASKVLLKHAVYFKADMEKRLIWEIGLSHMCEAFFQHLSDFENGLSQWKYWSRAWTFQEWSLARELDIACEATPDIKCDSLRCVKSSIFRAGTMLANYKLRNGGRATIRIGCSRSDAPGRFDSIRRLFPYEDYILSVDEFDGWRASYQTAFPSRGTDHLLGLRYPAKDRPDSANLGLKNLTDLAPLASFSNDEWRFLIPGSENSGFPTRAQLGLGFPIRRTTPTEKDVVRTLLHSDPAKYLRELHAEYDKPFDDSIRATEDDHFRARLGIMLNAFGMNTREATFEADLICCWASMCNIAYDYKKEDSFALALQKILKALRKRGVKIYNFWVNTPCPEVDITFLRYACEHSQSNATARTFLRGLPIFTGRADTAIHFLAGIGQSIDTTIPKSSGLSLRKLRKGKADVCNVSPLTDIPQVVSEFSKATFGLQDERSPASMYLDMDLERPIRKPEQAMFLDSCYFIQEILRRTPSSKLEMFRMVTARWLQMETKRSPPGNYMYYAWALCPANTPFADLFVARESLNGTLVLAYERDGQYYIAAYLAVTYQASGTYLLETDEDGELELIAQTPQRCDMLHASYDGKLWILQGRVDLEKLSFPASTGYLEGPMANEQATATNFLGHIDTSSYPSNPHRGTSVATAASSHHRKSPDPAGQPAHLAAAATAQPAPPMNVLYLPLF
ncbi:hypothetical protein K432DRAFT_423963 [Lepidopterella palustris CBS 459.81]|uniref:Heterokaryon incompatibility domain-containing protein n=1 Tax=Lepidopterella palustris CBS 459.81 TaxID=1314670 RepID=A0A8E2JHN1_9PEZI|nr:hypothetical protein K432DRAFT_423963 [Lepidopterella palustris CBS 459.81]